jgi:hypothetical protein
MVLEHLSLADRLMVRRLHTIFENMNLEYYLTGMRVLQAYYDIPFQTIDTDIHIIWKGQYDQYVWDTFHQLFQKLQQEIDEKEFRIVQTMQNLIIIRGKGVIIEISSHPISSSHISKYVKLQPLEEYKIPVATAELIIFGKLLRSGEEKDKPVLKYIFSEFHSSLDLNLLRSIIDDLDQTKTIHKELEGYIKT